MSVIEKTAVVLVVDGISAQHLGTYGNTAFDTPNLDRLAAGAELFEHCQCPNVVAEEAFESMILSRTKDSPSESFFESWQKKSITSILMTDDDRLWDLPAVDEFDQIIRLDSKTNPESKMEASSIDHTHLAIVMSQIVRQIQEVERPSVVWIQLKGMLSNWDAPHEMRAKLAMEDDPEPPRFTAPPVAILDQSDHDQQLGIQQAFAAQMSLFDFCLGVFLDAIDLEEQENLMLCVAGLRGYPLGEHEQVGKAEEVLNAESIHIPLILNRSELGPVTYRHQNLVSRDFLIKLVDRWLRQKNTTESLVSEKPQVHVTDTPGGYCVQTPAWKLIEIGQQCQLFAKPDDRWEINDVAIRCPDVVEMLQNIADVFRKDTDVSKIELPEILIEQFR